jgi:hypothetical protein
MRAFKFNKLIKVALAVVPVFVTTMALTAGAVGATHDAGRGRIEQVRVATAIFQSLSVAQAHKYGLLTDKNGIACIDNPGVGAMGVHYVNAEYLKDEAPDIKRPQAVMYEPKANGKLELVAVEYIASKGPASLEGQLFSFTGAPNRYGLGPFYELHVWAWKENPRGAFADMNPDVTCRHHMAAK